MFIWSLYLDNKASVQSSVHFSYRPSKSQSPSMDLCYSGKTFEWKVWLTASSQMTSWPWRRIIPSPNPRCSHSLQNLEVLNWLGDKLCALSPSETMKLRSWVKWLQVADKKSMFSNVENEGILYPGHQTMITKDCKYSHLISYWLPRVFSYNMEQLIYNFGLSGTFFFYTTVFSFSICSNK